MRLGTSHKFLTLTGRGQAVQSVTAAGMCCGAGRGRAGKYCGGEKSEPAGMLKLKENVGPAPVPRSGRVGKPRKNVSAADGRSEEGTTATMPGRDARHRSPRGCCRALVQQVGTSVMPAGAARGRSAQTFRRLAGICAAGRCELPGSRALHVRVVPSADRTTAGWAHRVRAPAPRPVRRASPHSLAGSLSCVHSSLPRPARPGRRGSG